MKRYHRLASVFLLFFVSPLFLHAQVPEWIWHKNDGKAAAENEVRYFRKTFVIQGKGKVAPTVLAVACDDEAEVWVNGKREMTVNGWLTATYADITKKIKSGENVIAVRTKNIKGDVGLLVYIEMGNGRNKKSIVSDTSWNAATEKHDGWEQPGYKEDANWSAAVSHGKLGDKPWGDVLKSPQATSPEALTVLPGFKVELLHSAQVGEGTWICMTTDKSGRLIISPQQDDLPLMRVTLSQGKVSKIEPVATSIHQAMGMCWAYNSLYVNGHGPQGTGLYRLIDSNHNDRFDTNEVHFLKKIPGEGEHGYHGIVEGPDGKIYMMNGNHTKVPDGVAKDSPHQHYQEDFLTARQWDANGHAVGILAPGGYMVRTDKDGKNWELMLGGFRNAYDFDFNADGEIFTYDSDMEWDWGLPWYRPTRINHCVTGAEFGWRSGSAVWPEYYADSLPATLNLSLGSPTGTKFGTKSNFPEKYRRAFYALDWSYGRIWAVHPKAEGASYSATSEVLVKGKPLNVSDVEFGKDGAMYFVTGGRGTQSGLYRVTYTGEKIREPKKTKEEREEENNAKEARALRHKLEAFHGKKNSAAVDFAWPYLKSEDRFLQFAARIAIESQDVALWKSRALAETNPEAGLTALLALARTGGKETQRDLLMALKAFPFDSLNDAQKLAKLRIIELSFIRQGKPDAELAKLATEKLSRLYPSQNEFMNQELCHLLVFLEAPDVVEKTLALLDKAQTQEEQIAYIFPLRNLKTGWTLDQRKHYFNWFKAAQLKGTNGVATFEEVRASKQHPAGIMRYFKEAGTEYADGNSFAKYLINIRKDAVANLSDDDRGELAYYISETNSAPVAVAAVKRQLVKEWKLADLETALKDASHGRDYNKGKAAFRDAQCILCHRFGNEGGAVGPDLTTLSSRFAQRDTLESILDPSKVVSEQFQNFTVIKKDGEDVTGRVVDETAEKIVLQPSPLAPETRLEIKLTDIAKKQPSKISPMPEGLLNMLTQEEILDLIAYVQSGGRKNDAAFKK
ncbi:MAG: heme-binding protein [Verrucomicrobiales bacterium]|nr:heme-binding protein [Verrucomicrobiales bacterium]